MRRLLPLVLLAGCASTTNGTSASSNIDQHAAAARAGVADDRLGALLVEHWAYLMKTNPVWATRLGDHRYDDRVGDRSKEAFERDRAYTREVLERAKALAGAPMSPADQTTLRLFTDMLQHDVDSEVCRFETWTISARGNPVTEYNELAQAHPIETLQDAQNLVTRYGAAAEQIDHITANLASGAADGLYANAESVRRVVEMVAKQLQLPTKEWPPMSVTKTKRDWSSDEQERFTRDLLLELDTKVRPALARYHELLVNSILPNARSAEESGLVALPFDGKCYEARVANFTGLPLTASELHSTGKKEIARINALMVKLGEKLFGVTTLSETLARLRTDPEIFFSSEEEIVKKAEAALAKARAAIPKYFGVLPKAECVVEKIPDYEAPFTTIAYYQQPVPDGSKPGEFYINVYEPKTRPKYEMEALAYHEAIPGHHLQIAIAQELPATPAFRKHLGLTAFVEGWALYTEQLADEMGLYSGDLDRMGMLSYEAWRAARLVVDTGIHAMGWSREQAKQYMLDHTALAANNVDNEVDRYISWPGQALGYKTGQLEIWRLRHAAENTLGNDFEIREFHDAVLLGGAVSLPVLRERVARWVAEVQAKRR